MTLCQLKNLVMILLITFVLAACGLKGDLYLPDEKQSSLITPHEPRTHS